MWAYVATTAPGADMWTMDDGMLEALIRQNEARVAERQVVGAQLCAMFAQAHGMKDACPSDFLPHRNKGAGAAAPQESNADEMAEKMREWVAAYKERTCQAS